MYILLLILFCILLRLLLTYNALTYNLTQDCDVSGFIKGSKNPATMYEVQI